MRHRATARFWRLYDKLPRETQQMADKNFELLKLNSKHRSLHFKAIRDDVWSVRIGLEIRALALKSAEGFDWIWIGHHDEYDRMIK